MWRRHACLTERPVGSRVTNVVKPEQCEAPCEDFCDKRRQSNPKNHYFQRKSHRIDDVCNNRLEIHTKTPPIDDVCNNTHRGIPKSQHDEPDRIGGTGGPGCDARGRRQVPAGRRADAPSHTSVHQAPLVRRAPEGPEGLAAVHAGCGTRGRQGLAEAGDDDATASQISHVIYRGHFSRCHKNVAIPTM